MASCAGAPPSSSQRSRAFAMHSAGDTRRFLCCMIAHVRNTRHSPVLQRCCGLDPSFDPVGDVDREGSLSDRSRSTTRKFDVDVIVIPSDGGAVWRLTDLLGRSMGNIRENPSHQFTIYPEGHAFETMADIHAGRMFPSTPPWLRSRGTREVFVDALQAEISFRRRLSCPTSPTAQPLLRRMGTSSQTLADRVAPPTIGPIRPDQRARRGQRA